MTLALVHPKTGDRVSVNALAGETGLRARLIRDRWRRGLRGDRLVESPEKARARAAKAAGRTRANDPDYAETMRRCYRRSAS